MSSNHIFRRYTCNLQAPYINASKGISIQGQTPTPNSFGGHTFPSTTHILTSSELSVLAKDSWSGTITFFVSSIDGKYQHVLMAVIVKTKGLDVQPVTYQTVGNLTKCILDKNSSNSIKLSTSVATVISWSCQSPFL
jgi:hypothetical protein